MNLVIANVTSGGLSGGYQKYIAVLPPLLRALPEVESLRVIVPPDFKTQYSLPGVDVECWPKGSSFGGLRWIRRRVRELNPSVVFIPSARWVDFGPIPTVVMVRNMEPLIVPWSGNSLLEGLKNKARAHAARTACKRATRVIAVSGFVRDYVSTEWAIQDSKIGVVYHGIDSDSGEAPKRPSGVDGLSDAMPTLFTAGSIRPARGLEDLVQAIGALKRKGMDCQLIVAGGVDRGCERYKEGLRTLSREFDIEKRICWAGRLDASEMAWCYKNTRMFVMTSRAEACPNIVLEAMSYGCLIVSTDQPPMPEFLTDSATYYVRRNSEDLGGALIRVLELSKSRVREFQERAVQRSADFKWAETAKQTMQQLSIASQQNPP